MSRSGRVILPFGNGRNEFFLDVPQLEELQRYTDAGPEHLYHRMTRLGFDGGWRYVDVKETIRLGLVGAGMNSLDAMMLVENYAKPGELLHAKRIAVMVLAAALAGDPDEDRPGEMAGESATDANLSPGESGDGAMSGGLPESSASATSEASRSGNSNNSAKGSANSTKGSRSTRPRKPNSSTP